VSVNDATFGRPSTIARSWAVVASSVQATSVIGPSAMVSLAPSWVNVPPKLLQPVVPLTVLPSAPKSSADTAAETTSSSSTT
jgi:hypothetical protein